MLRVLFDTIGIEPVTTSEPRVSEDAN
jgi:hypothetical protein